MEKFTAVFIFFTIFFSVEVKSQCIGPDFSVPANNCVGQKIELSVSDPAQVSYEWDFCPGDLSLTPTASVFLNSNSTGGAFKVELVEDNGNYYGFFTSRNGRKLYRLDFGSDINVEPVVVDLGGLNANNDGWLTIDIVKEGSDYYGFIIDFSNKVYRTKFGSSIEAQPSDVETIYSGGQLAAPIDMMVLDDGSSKYIFVANYSSSNVTRLTFPSSFNDESPALIADLVPITGSGNLAGISFIRDCDTWFAITTSLSGTIAKAKFANGLGDLSPAITLITGLSFTPAAPAGVSLVQDNGQYLAFIQSNSTSDLYRLEFGTSLSNDSPTGTNLGNFGLLSGVWGFSMHKVRSHWLTLSSENVGPRIFRLTFPDNCFSDTQFSTDAHPVITTTESGTFPVSISVRDASGQAVSTVKSIDIADLNAPQFSIAMNPEVICSAHEAVFTPATMSETLTSYEWNFGDNTASSPDEMAEHQFEESGNYLVRLSVTDENGCGNFATSTVKVYHPPVASFTLPDGQLCTNSEEAIINTTVDNGYDGLLTFEWFVNDDAAGNTLDLAHVFLSPGTAEVRLVASLPGCSDEDEQVTSEILEGPDVNFLTEGHCENETIFFVSEVSDPVIAYEWSFGDGNSSSEQNPEHLFSSNGDFQVSLTAVTESGCNSVVTENITVHPQPNPDFTIELQPVYCTNIGLNFTGTTPDTDDPIQLATWDFNDGSAPSSGMVIDHQFEKAGTYDVSFEATTHPGCSNIIVKQIAVYPTPGIEFVSSPACVGAPVDFTASTTGTINTWQWQISDKSYSNDQPTHIFRTPGVYAASVTVTDINGCAASLSEVVSVPDPLEPDFAVLKNCVSENAVLTDITVQGDDPIASWTWQVDEEPALTGNPLVFVFSKAEEVPVTLNVVTESGCSYFVSKDVEVVPFPEASFTMSSEIGSPPFPVNFTNQSEDAGDYAWDFGDGNISNEESPAHEYTEIGEFTVTLTASNPEGCEHSSTKEISISPAQPDIRIMAVTATENPDKTVGIMVTLYNDGNTIIYDLPLDIDISGTVQVREIIEGPVLPRSRVNFSLGYGVSVTEAISFLCATATLAGDVEPETNRNCVEFASEVVFLPGYPNPAKEFLQIEWVAPLEETVQVSLKNTLGNDIWTLQFVSKKGLNQKIVEVENLQKGIYMLILESPRVTTMQRILIAR